MFSWSNKKKQENHDKVKLIDLDAPADVDTDVDTSEKKKVSTSGSKSKTAGSVSSGEESVSKTSSNLPVFEVMTEDSLKIPLVTLSPSFFPSFFPLSDLSGVPTYFVSVYPTLSDTASPTSDPVSANIDNLAMPKVSDAAIDSFSSTFNTEASDNSGDSTSSSSSFSGIIDAIQSNYEVMNSFDADSVSKPILASIGVAIVVLLFIIRKFCCKTGVKNMATSAASGNAGNRKLSGFTNKSIEDTPVKEPNWDDWENDVENKGTIELVDSTSTEKTKDVQVVPVPSNISISSSGSSTSSTKAKSKYSHSEPSDDIFAVSRHVSIFVYAFIMIIVD